ncbi:DUF3575 domain-containing protein [Kaistella antarctica]|uniref:Protein of uncharacterized function (DUF3575) n=1 Tax=Kaistella antarctica TaxID=266748 RepID=A0A448NUW8_9FLAO|nr:DUF3575 domain-containing protein [Kaistella antarctica]KEY20355.1 hypothetical protein HY04_03910 [Kaistella antarctica]SEV90608.1 Protein of unknown function [Kaistella antarctica]VEI01505.1 Protein of uncharacterised function (DUF3575) [Kaistella antarctica]
MNKIIFALLISATVGAQNSADDKMNIVKTNVTAYAFRNVNLTYERIINQKFSVAIGFGSMGKGSVPFSKSYIKDTELSNVEVSLTNFTIEPRIYLGKGYGHGFYLAPYYRYTSFNADNIVLTGNYGMGDVPLKISGKASGNSAGLMVGAQWFLGKTDNWVLDFWMAGGHYGKGKGDFRGTSNRTLSPAEQQELKKKIDGLDIPFVKYTSTTDANGANILVDGPWAGVRSGLSVGYRF